MDKESIMKEIDTFVINGKISCKKALELAEKNNISPKALGDLLNDAKIKVSSCQLGCFP
jgi:hypothetical protein